MDETYKAPNSNLDSDDERTAIVRQLFDEQSYLAATLGALFGLIPGIVLTIFIASNTRGFVTIMILLIPGFCAGLLMKFCGRAFEVRVRLPASILTSLVTLLFLVILPSYIIIFIAFLNGLIAMGLSRRNLSYAQESALYAYRIGKVKL